MKFIGQYIQSLIARFRGDVYLEKVASDSVEGSPDSDTFLALKSGKVVRTAGSTGGSITVKESDDSPSVSNVTTIKVTDGTLTNNGSGVVTIDTGGSDNNIFKRNDNTYPTSVSDFTQGGITYDFILNQVNASFVRMSVLNEQQTGIHFVNMNRSFQLTFNISNLNLRNSGNSNVSDSTNYLIGSTTTIWQANCKGFFATLNNLSGGTISSGTLSFTNRSSTQTFGSSTINIETSDLTSGNLSNFRDGLPEADVNIYYPNDNNPSASDGWSSGKKTLRFTVTIDDGVSSDSKHKEFDFYNKFYHGTDSNATLTGNYSSNSGSGSIFNLAQDPFATTSVSVNQSFTTSGTQYYHLAYPYRYGAKTSFQIDGGPATSLFEVNNNLTVVNQYGYSERYYHYRTGNAFTDAGPFTITIS